MDKAASPINAWQDKAHVTEFDGLWWYPDFLLRRRFDAFNEVRLLQSNAQRIGPGTLFEIGCATGEFGRYVRRYLPGFQYRGFDISQPAIDRAVAKYGDREYVLFDGNLQRLRVQSGTAHVVFCRDVVLHQLDPFAFLTGLLGLAERALVLRLRTREVGPTVTDTERSCQYHYDHHWVPYIVINTAELIERISRDPGVAEIVIGRRFEPLGGHNWRLLPKNLYYSETRSAETAVLVLKGNRTGAQPAVSYADKPDGPRWTFSQRALLDLFRKLRA